eukprot:8613237-Prorocentrum_lima.AAC.1
MCCARTSIGGNGGKVDGAQQVQCSFHACHGNGIPPSLPWYGVKHDIAEVAPRECKADLVGIG